MRKIILGWILFVGGIILCLYILAPALIKFGGGATIIWLLIASGAIYFGWHYIRGGK